MLLKLFKLAGEQSILGGKINYFKEWLASTFTQKFISSSTEN